MKKTKNNKIMLFVVVIIIILNLVVLFLNYNVAKSLKQNIIIGASIENESNNTLPEINLSDNPLSLEGFSKANISVENNAILLQVNCSLLGLFTNDIQLYSIRQGLQKTIDIRPTIHDTFVGVLDNFNISLILVKITDARDDLYFANLYFKSGKNLLNVDAKPSDAIALALRTNTSIYIKDTIMQNYGRDVCKKENKSSNLTA